MVKCTHCGYEGPVQEFRYLYNVRLEEKTGNRECPKCFGWVVVDEELGELAASELQNTVPGVPGSQA